MLQYNTELKQYSRELRKNMAEAENLLLKSQGNKVLRFSDREIFENLRGVIERINENL